MNRVEIILSSSICAILAGCQTPPSAQTVQAATVLAGTLATYAAQHNTTAAKLVSKGVLICGQASSVPGQLLIGSAVAVANSAGAPVNVTNQASADVAAACAALGMVPGPLPAGSVATLPTVTVPTTTLPPVNAP